jgi:hypothetical protein
MYSLFTCNLFQSCFILTFIFLRTELYWIAFVSSLSLFVSSLCSFVCLFLSVGTYDDFVNGHYAAEAACKYSKISIIIIIIIIIIMNINIMVIITRDF